MTASPPHPLTYKYNLLHGNPRLKFLRLCLGCVQRRTARNARN